MTWANFCTIRKSGKSKELFTSKLPWSKILSIAMSLLSQVWSRSRTHLQHIWSKKRKCHSSRSKIMKNHLRLSLRQEQSHYLYWVTIISQLVKVPRWRLLYPIWNSNEIKSESNSLCQRSIQKRYLQQIEKLLKTQSPSPLHQTLNLSDQEEDFFKMKSISVTSKSLWILEIST